MTQLKEKIVSVEGNGGVTGLYEFDSENMFLPILISEKVLEARSKRQRRSNANIRRRNW